MIIRLNQDEISTAITSLDTYSRIFMGQYDHINWEIRFNASFKNDDWKKVEMYEAARTEILKQIRDIVMPDLKDFGFHGSYGIWNDRINPKAIDAYDLQQVIRYKDAWHCCPEGGFTRNFDRPWIRGRYPEAKAEITGDKDNYEMTLILLPEQFGIMEEAARVHLYLHTGKFEELFKIYTSKGNALVLAKKAEEFNVVPYPDTTKRAEEYLASLHRQSI